MNVYLSILMQLGVFSFVFSSAIIFHEIGHLLFIKKFGGKAVLTLRKNDLVVSLPERSTNKEKEMIIVAGVILGFLPAFLLFYIDNSFLFLFLLFYLIGCRHDLKMVRDLLDVKS